VVQLVWPVLNQKVRPHFSNPTPDLSLWPPFFFPVPAHTGCYYAGYSDGFVSYWKLYDSKKDEVRRDRDGAKPLVQFDRYFIGHRSDGLSFDDQDGKAVKKIIFNKTLVVSVRYSNTIAIWCENSELLIFRSQKSLKLTSGILNSLKSVFIQQLSSYYPSILVFTTIQLILNKLGLRTRN